MRIPTLAVCTLATIAAQDFAQSAHSLPVPESIPESALQVNPRVVSKSPIAASLSKMAIPEPIATVQVEFSRPAISFQAAPLETAPLETAPLETAPLETAPLETAPLETAPLETAPLETAPLETAPLETAPLETAPQLQASFVIAQTTTIDELEELEPEPESAPAPESEPEPQSVPQPDKAPDPQVPDRPSETPAPPESGQYLQEEPPSPSPSPSSPSSPSTHPPIHPSTHPTPAPPSSGLVTEPIAPTVQIGDVPLPHRGALPADFAFPIRIRVTIDRSITTNTPITDSTENLAAWAARVRACLDEKPQLFAVRADGRLAPILFNGQQGRIIRNANRRMVCANAS